MKLLHHPLIFVTVLISIQADAVLARTRRGGDQVPLSGQLRDYAVSSPYPNTKAQLSTEIGEGDADNYANLQTPNGFSFDGSNEGGESFKTETNLVSGYDGEYQVNEANILDENNFLPPSGGFVYGKEADAANQSKTQTQFRQEAQYSAENQADTGIQENQEIQYSQTPKVLPPAQEIMQFPKGTIPLVRPLVNSGYIKNTLQENLLLGSSSELLNKPGPESGSLYAGLPNKASSSNPTYAHGGPFVVTNPQVDRGTIAYTDPGYKYTPSYQQDHPVSHTGMEINFNKSVLNRYDITQSPNLIQHQKEKPNKSLVPTDVASLSGNYNKNWNPYTKPAEGEIMVQAEGDIQTSVETEADITAQENGNPSLNWNPYQKGKQNKYWNPYTKPAEGETLVQVPGDIETRAETEADITAQENGNPSLNLNPYQKGNQNKYWNPYTKPAEGETLVQVPGDIETRVETEADITAQENGNPSLNLNPYQKGNQNKYWNPYTKPAEGETLVQVAGGIQNSEKTVADFVAQENGNRNPNFNQYQKENPNKSLVPTDVVSLSSNYNKNWNPYTKPAEGETLVQAEEEIQTNVETEADITAQENGKPSLNLNQYQKGNQNKYWNPYTKPAEGETLVQVAGDIQTSVETGADITAQENGNPSLNWNPYQKGKQNKYWNPYTKPAEGETLVQVPGDIETRAETEADITAQENGNLSLNLNPYQKGNQNKYWNPYTKPAEGETLVQAAGDIQNSVETEADITAQENGNPSLNLNPYQKGNQNKYWNPYTKPAEGETLVQSAGDIQNSVETGADITAQENGNPSLNLNPYQKGNQNKYWNPYTKPAEGETLVQSAGDIQNSVETGADITAQENGNPSLNWNPYQKGKQNKYWNPYTKPAEGETLVQVPGDIETRVEIEADIKAQENGNPSFNLNPYQKGNQNKYWNPYTKPAEGETLVQVAGDIQTSVETEADITAQENGNPSLNWNPYQKGNQNKYWNPYTKPAEGETLVQAKEEIQTNVETEADITAQENGYPSLNLNPYQKGNQNKYWNPYTKPAEGETLVQAAGDIQTSVETEADITAQENGNPSLNWNPYQKGKQNKYWNPYTKPAEGETLVQVPGDIETRVEIEADIKAQENGNPSFNLNPYQKGNQNKYWNPYTKPAEGETLVQVAGDIQTSVETEADITAQENGNPSLNWNPYQKGNQNKYWNPYTKPAEGETLVQAKEEIQTNVETEADITAQENGYPSLNLNPYQKGNQNKYWNPYTKPAEGETLVQAAGDIQTSVETEADITAQENGNPSLNLNPYQKGNQNKYWNPYTKPAEGETLVQSAGDIQNSVGTEADITAQENGNPSLNLNPYQKGNQNKYWNPYTKPAEGETLVQVPGDIETRVEIEADIKAQENGNPSFNLNPYQKGNQNKYWNPYTKPAEGETLVQTAVDIQTSVETEADITAQENGNPSLNWNPYQKGNQNKYWNPYTKPAEGETLVQVPGDIETRVEIEADITAQENGNPSLNLNPYQKGNQNKYWNPYTKPAEGETLVQAAGDIETRVETEADITAQDNGNPSPDWNAYQKGNQNKYWNPYTKPAEGETLVQVAGDYQTTAETEADITAQENGNPSPNWNPYQKGNQNKYWNPYTKPAEGEILVQAEEDIQNSEKTVAAVVAQENGYRNPNFIPYQKRNQNKYWNPYTKPAEGETLVQSEEKNQNSQSFSESQYESSTQANIVAQSNGGFQYSGEDKKVQAYITSSDIGAQGSESSIFGNIHKYNDGYLNGQEDTNVHLQNDAEFGAVINAETAGQAGPVVDTRFGQTTHPPRQPLPAYAYRQPSGWNHW